MDIDDSPSERAHRERVRAYLEEHLHSLVRNAPADPESPAEVERYRRTQRLLYEGGLVGATWPVEYGGGGATRMAQAIIDQELAGIGVPPLVGQIGLGMCGPTLIEHGTAAQKRRYLGPILSAEEIWAQMFSEPGAGSDLAGVSTRAVRDGDGWRITGQKVWTSGAHYSDWGMILTRTDPSAPRHRGLTMFVIDLRAPGVEIRPLRQMSGASAFNEVFLDSVAVPADAVLGPVGEGWKVALTTLLNERMAIGGGGGDLGGSIEALGDLAAEVLPTLPAERQAVVRHELGRLQVRALACRWTGYRRLTALSRDEIPGPEASAGKVAGTALARDIVKLAVSLLGADAAFAAGADGSAHWQHVRSLLPGLELAGGATEILKNVLGERVLGLPREPRPEPAAARDAEHETAGA
ncbi:acyl-CoA dehydrogenase family protein [Actinocorallia sp. A-T 12471]|uniref:acyl-CoA dehydrogenase family protein n=1 Tax=Actinocorallia sp. A-T 12471 TaxID=3089813 RepID=UPI0029D0B376|nr:acyl-CoA dehydrogenase family protein [Actinocorallia sp. A-T 12471]MDX6743540.1 acyl-CoA dehydrogenase family protein [Actinocorallia sp. A-T 12471]